MTKDNISLSTFQLQLSRLLAGGIASLAAEFATLPMDCMKVGLQTQIQRNSINHGILHVANGIYHEGGIKAFWNGATPALVRQMLLSSVSMAIYDPITDFVTKLAYANTDPSKSNEHISYSMKLLGGGIAGIVGICLSNPMDVIKVRMQGDRKRTRYLNLKDAVLKMYAIEGLSGATKGLGPAIQRGFIVSAAELGSYHQAKEWFLQRNVIQKDGVILHSAASIVAGFAGAAASNPIDILKTRLMNQPTVPDGKRILYKGAIDCGYKLLQKEGPLAFYKGFLPNWLRKGPWCMIFFISYEKTKTFLIDDA